MKSEGLETLDIKPPQIVQLSVTLSQQVLYVKCFGLVPIWGRPALFIEPSLNADKLAAREIYLEAWVVRGRGVALLGFFEDAECLPAPALTRPLI
jgi:hypothetical protein